MITRRVGDGVSGLNASLLPRQREDGLQRCNGAACALLVAGTGLAPRAVSQACPAATRARASRLVLVEVRRASVRHQITPNYLTSGPRNCSIAIIASGANFGANCAKSARSAISSDPSVT